MHAQLLGRVHLCDPVDCSPPGSSAHGISQARILEWVVIPFSRGSNSGIKPTSPASIVSPTLQADSLLLSHQVSPFRYSQFSSVAQSCPTLCDTMNRSTPGLPVHHQLPEFTQTHVHRVNDAIQPSILCRPLLIPPSNFPRIRIFSNELVLRIKWPKYWFHLQHQFFQ